MGVGRLLVRGAIGTFFIGHGTQKLFGWFGGSGPEGTAGFFESIGIRPGRRNAVAAGTAEAGGGLLLALGLATPAAATALSSVMLTAIRHVHFKNGPWSSDGGYEYNAVLLATLFVLVDEGPGPLSLDAARGKVHSGLGWATAMLALAAAGSYAATAAGAAGEDVEDEATPREEAVEAEKAGEVL
ncbi:MAG TPA: DoxX family protein [Gaiellaceae bacterium]|jgi:putative oxidoreductase|nr:DoxX family protein [Gaiellaceae bacterium]